MWIQFELAVACRQHLIDRWAICFADRDQVALAEDISIVPVVYFLLFHFFVFKFSFYIFGLPSRDFFIRKCPHWVTIAASPTYPAFHRRLSSRIVTVDEFLGLRKWLGLQIFEFQHCFGSRVARLFELRLAVLKNIAWACLRRFRICHLAVL